jgi:hypothetical protein
MAMLPEAIKTMIANSKEKAKDENMVETIQRTI